MGQFHQCPIQFPIKIILLFPLEFSQLYVTCTWLDREIMKWFSLEYQWFILPFVLVELIWYLSLRSTGFSFEN